MQRMGRLLVIKRSCARALLIVLLLLWKTKKATCFKGLNGEGRSMEDEELENQEGERMVELPLLMELGDSFQGVNVDGRGVQLSPSDSERLNDEAHL